MSQKENSSQSMKPEPFSILGLYGDRRVFAKKLDEGFTEVAFGQADWVGDHRVVAMFAFYHPDGRIATLEYHKFIADFEGTTSRGKAQSEFTEETWKQFQKENGVKLVARSTLAGILNIWVENR